MTVIVPPQSPLVIGGVQVPAILRELGFSHVAPSVGGRRRIFISSEGDPSAGKTHFIGTAPGPVIAVVDFDRGTAGVLDDVRKVGGKLVMKKTFPMISFDETEDMKTGKDSSVDRLVVSTDQQKLAVEVYTLFKKYVSSILRARNLDGSRQVDTLAVDNAGDAYTISQAAHYARLSRYGEIEGRSWRIANYEFEQIFKEADDNNVNLIVTHRRKAVYGAAGEKKLDGYEGMMNAAQAHILHHKGLVRVNGIPVVPHKAERKIIFIKSRQRPALEEPDHKQHELPILMMGEDQWFGGQFIDVARAVFPNSTDAEWFGEAQ